MSRAPWTADHELDAAGARARITAAFPDLRPRDVRYFAEGYDFRMFQVDSDWLFRFPKRAGEVLRLEREVALLDVLAGRLPVAVPEYEYRAPGLAGYRKLDGLNMVGRRAEPAFAASLAEFASALQAIDVGDLPLPGEQDAPGYAQLREDVRKGLAAARPKLEPELHARCASLLDGPLPPPFAGEPRLVHNDLYPEHLLLAADGTIRAVLDWGDAVRGDPAGEFAVAFFRGGDGLLQAALDRYAGEIGSGFEDRARFGGTCMAISHATYGARTGKADYLRSGIEALERVD